tara:strand:- start:136 stop:483 length:348 start_codon:yes stop_codon:yes gene_type:complete
MKIQEIVTESVVQVWSRNKGGQMVRKYRCLSGARKGRIVSNPSVCTQPKKMGSMMGMKRAKARRGSTMNIKRSFTKRTNPSSIRLRSLNKARSLARFGGRRSASSRPSKRRAIRK